MPLKFNPFTAQFDLTGSGGGASYIDGEVATYNDLPLDGSAALNSAWLVRSSSGIWPFNKPAGIYYRSGTLGVSRDADYTFGGTLGDVFSDSVFLLYDEASTTRTGQFNLGSITAGQNRVLTWPDGNATIAAVVESRLQTFSTSTTYNVAEGLNVDIALQNPAASCAIVVVLPRLTTDGARNNDEILLRPTSLGSGSSYTLQRYIWTGSSYIGSTETITTMEVGQAYRLRLVGGVWTLLVTPNLASPPAIGSTTRNSGAFTTLSSNVGTITASTPLAVTQTWNNSATNFRAIETSITNTASQTESFHLACSVSGSLVAYIRRDGRIVAGANVYGSTGLESALLPQGVAVGSASYIGFCSNSFANDAGGDLRLFRDAANTLGQRNGTNPQTFRLYNTFTDASNYERGFMRWSSNVLQIGTEKAGTGSARALQFQTDGTTRVTVDATGQVGIGVAPERPFHIQGSAAFIRVDRQGSFGPALLFTRMATGTTVTSSWLFGPTDQVAGVSNDDFAIIDFGTSVGGTSGTQRLTISKSTGQLTVNGNLNLATKDLVTDTTTGTKIGTGTTQKLGFFNATPIVRPAAIADATDAATTQARLNDLLAAMRSLGLIAT